MIIYEVYTPHNNYHKHQKVCLINLSVGGGFAVCEYACVFTM